jgi:hypothetical protein
MARGVTAKTHTRIMRGARPDATGRKDIHNQCKIGMDHAGGHAAAGLLARLRKVL